MRTIKTVIASLAMAVAIGGAIAAGQKTTAPTVYIDNGPGIAPTEVDLAELNQEGGWRCELPATSPCYFEEYDEANKELLHPSENGNYSPM